MSKYRFKTREEFIRDDLWNKENNCPHEWAWGGEMNKYLGMDVPDELNVYCNKKEDFQYDGWYFRHDEYVLKEQQQYFPDLSQHIGRYIRALVDNPFSGSGVKKGDVGKIISDCRADFPNRKAYSCTLALSKKHLGVTYELLPEDYSPEQENKKPNVEFIPGKWYKVELSNKFNHYIKVDSVTEDEIVLDYEGYVANLNKWDKGTSINLKTVTKYELLTYLSEIQKYLPDEHPDKVKNFKLEAGKWYSFNWDCFGKDRIVIAKIKVVKEDQFSISWRSYLWSDKSYSDSDAYHFKDISNIKELSVKEIQPYLPEGHPDKVTKQKFEIGKWYKWYQKNHDSFHYGKLDSITDTTIIMKPWIMQCNSYRERGGFDINSVQQITEVSYSEIEQFLPEDMKETKEFPKYWFVKNNKQPELLEYAGYISKQSPAWWKSFPYIGYDGVKSLNGIHGCVESRFINDAIEISFEEFLENIYYVKFPKKRKQKSEFVLPEKWYTKPKTNEEKDVLNKFVVDLKDNHWKIEDKHSYKHTPHFKNRNYQRATWIGYEDNDYTEITFEQFKKYVLKDKSVASTDKVKYVIATSEEAVFVYSVVESVSISILNVEDSKILPLPKSIESVKTKLN